MELLVGLGHALHDLDGLLDGGFVNRHGLEAALQGGVLLDVLAVLGEGGGADDLDLAPGEGGLEDVGCVHAALGIAGAHQIVDLVDDENDVAALLDLADQRLHAALELAPELGTGHQGGQVQQEDLLVPKLIGHISGGDPLGQALGDGGLADAGLTDETGVVLLAAVEDLDDPLGLHIPADDLVELPFPGTARQVHAVGVQELVLLGLFLALLSLFFLLGLLGQLGGQVAFRLHGVAAEELVQQREGSGLAVHLVVIVLALGGDLAEHIRHLVLHHIQILLGNAHLLDGLADLGDIQAPGALETVALIGGLAPIHPGDKHHRHAFLTFGAELHLHWKSLLRG